MAKSMRLIFLVSMTTSFSVWAQVGPAPTIAQPVATTPTSATPISKSRLDRPQDGEIDQTSPATGLSIGRVRAKKGEISRLTELLESGSSQNIKTAVDSMIGSNEADVNKQTETRRFWALYVTTVLQVGDDSDKRQAAQFLQAMAGAAPLEDHTSRVQLNLWGMMEPALLVNGEGGGSFFVTPPGQLRQWLLATRVYAQLQPSAAH